MLEKTLHFIYEDKELVLQETSPLFLLSVILEEFVSERENDPSMSSEVALAKRLDDFIWSPNSDYFDS